MERLLIISICILLNTFCCSFAQNKEDKIISQDELLKMFQSSDNIWETFTYDVWRNLDKKDLSQNKKLQPYFLKLLDYDEHVKAAVEDYMNKKTFSENHIISFLRERNILYMKDTILNNPDLHKAYLDSVKSDYRSAKCRSYSKNGIHMPNSVIELFCYLKSPEGYKILYNMWKTGVKHKGIYTILLEYLDPDVMSFHKKNITNCDEKQDYTYGMRISNKESLLFTYHNLLDYGVYSIDWWIEMLRCQKKFYVDLANMDMSAKYVSCPFNVAILRMYSSELYASNSKYCIDLIDKIFCPKCEYDVDKPIYKMTYKELQKISDDIVEHVDEIAQAIQPYRDEIEKKDNVWRSKMPYYDRIKIQK